MREALTLFEPNLLPADQPLLYAAFDRFFAQSAESLRGMDPFQTEFRILSGRTLKICRGVFLPAGENSVLFCCSDITDQREAERLRRENHSLKQTNRQIKEVFRCFSGEMLVFKVENNIVTPLHINETICDFFGLERGEWIRTMGQGRPVAEFIANSSISREQYDRLLRDGEIEVNYIDVANDEERRMRAVLTEVQGGNGPVSYVMLRDVTENAGNQAAKPAAKTPEADAHRPDVYIRTFGYFDVFVDGKPIAFKNEKTKELFAILVDRRGGFVSSGEAIGYLWEDEPSSKITLSRYRKVALRLRNFLDECGIADIVEAVDGKRRIVTERVRCDLFEYLTHDPQFEHLFNGLYLLNYSWAETTLGELQRLSGQSGSAEFS